MADYKDKDGAQREHDSLMSSERRKFERLQEKAEAMEKGTAKALGKAIRAHKKQLAKEAANAVKRNESGQMSALERAMVNAAQSGAEVVYDHDEVITGQDPLPWDDDSDY